jgi:SNF2 family DNA or RNA helicase
MLSVDISDKQIKELAPNQSVYRAGVGYFQAGKVVGLHIDPDERKINASVTGTFPYNVEIIMSRLGAVRDYDCTCPAFYNFPGACKHVIAVLYAVQMKRELQKKPPAKDQVAKELLNYFANQRPEKFLTELNLELELQIRLGHRISAELSLRVGLQRLYVVKEIGEFLDCIKTGRELEYGKNFTFEPHNMRFNEHDRAVIQLLLDMYEGHLAWQELENPFDNSSPFKKHLPLTGIYLKKFLDALGDRSFILCLGSLPPFESKVKREALPLEFTLKTQGEDLALVFETDKLPVKLTRDGSYFVFGEEIYFASPDQREVLPHLVKDLQKGISQTLLLPAQTKEFFVSEALPTVERLGKLKIQSDLEAKFSREELSAKIFFEKGVGNGIAARVEFHYGLSIINPFSPNRNAQATEDVILIRAVEEERDILNIFEQADFSVTQGKIHLDDEQKIFEFAITYLPLLQDKTKIYYSEDFKLNIRSSMSFSGRIRLDESLDLLEVSFEYGEMEPDELAAVFDALQLKKKYFRLKDGSFLDLNQPELDVMAKLLDNLDLTAENFSGEIINLPKYRAMYIDNYLRQANLPGVQRNLAFKNFVQSILEPQDGDFEPPEALMPVLRDYQKTGFKWLKTLTSYGLGGILADDMGLGKTLQVLSFILFEKGKGPGPALVIAPTSLIYNWQEEANRFTPELKVLVVEGNPSIRRAQLEGVNNWDLVVTSYPLFRRDTEIYGDLEFSYCFLDEAQHIKNPHTINAKSVQQIKAKGYFALTGTPIENSLSELWSIFNFVMPGYLLSHEQFRKKYEMPIIRGEDPAPLVELGRHVTPFILRRLKSDVLTELPEKIETRLKAQMTDAQRKIYLAFLQEAKSNIAREIKEVGFEKSHIKILAALTRLRQICCHPGMFIEDYSGESGKMELFKEVLADALDGGHRVLVFSQFTSMLDIIQNHLSAEGIEHFYLSGSTKAADRSQMVKNFNDGAGKVFLISLKAGGTGLNLTGADMVIHFDPWWNPAVEEQATDRAHRIGQKKVVQVIKLVTQGTIEEKVYALQEKKKELIESVIQPGETWLAKMSEQELRDLFDLS